MRLIRLWLFIPLALMLNTVASADDFEPDHRLVLYVTENSEHKMTAALNIAANVSRHYDGKGELVEIKIVAFNNGMHMLRQDSSPVLERLRGFSQSMPNVSFIGCGNTLHSMERNEGSRPVLVEGVEMVEAGVTALIEMDEAGWTLVHP